MLKQFLEYISTNNLFSEDNKLLLAVSGGADSIVLADLCIKAGFKISIAHCNFKLRRKDADSDERFVNSFAKKNNIEYHIIHFKTTEYAQNKKISIEMAARELRYNWFYELKNKFGYDYIVTGHHLNDSIETLFLNLTRGTGYKGISGIDSKRNHIVRPMLFATRTQIEEYAKKNNIQFCTDVTNQSEQFIRNKIRNSIIPIFKDINPAFEKVMLNNLQHLNDVSLILDKYFNSYKENTLKKKNGTYKIYFSDLLESGIIKTNLFELINNFGFSADTINKVAEGVVKKNKTGAVFFSKTHKLLIDRDSIIISEANNTLENYPSIKSIDDFNKYNLKAKIVDYDDFTMIKNKNTACIDADSITFPLKMRKWQQGDYFYPLGMRGKQKISDYFINNKVNIFEKEKAILLTTNNNEIIWILDYRIDNRFKVNQKTTRVLVIEIVN